MMAIAIQLIREHEPTKIPKILSQLLSLAVLYFYNLGNNEQSMKLVSEVEMISSKPLGDVFFLKGRIYEKQEKYEDAVKQYLRAEEFSNHAQEAAYRIGKVYNKLGQKKASLNYLKKSLSLDQMHFSSAKAIANILMSKGQYERASKYFKHALRMKDNDESALYGFSVCLYKQAQQRYHNDPSRLSQTFMGR